MKTLFTLLVMVMASLNAMASMDIKATFKADKQSGALPLSVSFKGVDENPGLSYNWDFGNGSTSMLKEPTTMYVNPGTYTVKLVVSNGVEKDTSYMSIDVLPNPSMIKTYREKVTKTD